MGFSHRSYDSELEAERQNDEPLLATAIRQAHRAATLGGIIRLNGEPRATRIQDRARGAGWLIHWDEVETF